MKTFNYTIKNDEPWAITDKEIIVVSENKKSAQKALKEAGYSDVSAKELVELNVGVHIIQDPITE